MALLLKGEAMPAEDIWCRQGLLLLTLAFLIGLHALSSYLPLHDFIDIPIRSQMKIEVSSPTVWTNSKERAPSARVIKVPPVESLDINRASRDELMTLPGIGPVLAEHIVEYRKEKGRFVEISEIRDVRGIGEKRFEKIRGMIQIKEGGK